MQCVWIENQLLNPPFLTNFCLTGEASEKQKATNKAPLVELQRSMCCDSGTLESFHLSCADLPVYFTHKAEATQKETVINSAQQSAEHQRTAHL